MNLINSPWIPVASGKTITLKSLREIFNEPLRGQIRCPTPMEDVAIQRLLVAIAMAALQPRSTEDIDKWVKNPLPAASLILEYLEKWHDRFELFSLRHPFMQVEGMTQEATTSVSVLCLARATGNTPALFDHSRDESPRGLSPEEAARALVAHQAFAVALGKSPTVILGGQRLARGSRKDGTCTRGLMVWLTGNTVIETVLINLLPITAGTPGWEDAEAYWKSDGLSQIESIPFDGLCDRYTMMSRMVRLIQDDDGKVRQMYYSMGRSAADEQGPDPMSVYYLNTKTSEKNRQAAPLSGLTWSLLERILEPGGNQIIEQAERLSNLPGELVLKTAGLRSEFGKAAKMVGWNRDIIPRFGKLIKDTEFRKQTITAIGEASKGESAIWGERGQAFWTRLTPNFYHHLACGSYGEEWTVAIERSISTMKKHYWGKEK